MSNETKRDVFEEALSPYKDGDVWHKKYLAELRARYDAALPDNIPVIPEDVSEWLTWCKRSNHSLKDGLDCETRVSEDIFATAWVLGAWKVDETGEIVKLEAEDDGSK